MTTVKCYLENEKEFKEALALNPNLITKIKSWFFKKRENPNITKIKENIVKYDLVNGDDIPDNLAIEMYCSNNTLHRRNINDLYNIILNSVDNVRVSYIETVGENQFVDYGYNTQTAAVDPYIKYKFTRPQIQYIKNKRKKVMCNKIINDVIKKYNKPNGISKSQIKEKFDNFEINCDEIIISAIYCPKSIERYTLISDLLDLCNNLDKYTLIFALEENLDDNIIKKIVEKYKKLNMDINVINEMGRNASAIAKNKNRYVSALYGLRPFELSPKTFELAEKLIINGVDPNYIFPSNKTLLTIAIKSGKLENVKKAVEYGANVNLINKNDYPLKSVVCIEIPEMMDIFKYLVSQGAKMDLKYDNATENLLYYAYNCNNREVVQYLLKTNIKFNDIMLLRRAIELNDIEYVDILLNKGAKEEDAFNNALDYNNEELIKRFTKKGLNINLFDVKLRITIKLYKESLQKRFANDKLETKWRNDYIKTMYLMVKYGFNIDQINLDTENTYRRDLQKLNIPVINELLKK